MSGAEIVAVVSVVVTGVISPYIVQRWGMLRLRWETRRDRENQLVDLMEQAALALVDAQNSIQDDQHRLTRQRLESQDADALAQTHKARLGNLWALETQIALRLTTDAAEARAFNSAASALAGGYAVLAEVMYGQPFDTERIQAFNAKYREASTARERFQNAVAERIGPGAP